MGKERLAILKKKKNFTIKRFLFYGRHGRQSYKNFFRLSITIKYYTTNSIRPFVAIEFIILNFCRQLLFSLCIANCHVDTVIK